MKQALEIKLGHKLAMTPQLQQAIRLLQMPVLELNTQLQEALETNRRQLFTLPDNTVVCPGHGPMTSIGEEKAHNPFYPEFKS